MPKKSTSRKRSATKRKAGVIRTSATPVRVYNEGLCVYLHDEGNAEAIRKLLASAKYRGCNLKKDFYSNLTNRAFAKAIAAKGLAVAYTLEQDDEIEVEVAVGSPLTERELSAARWLEPQYARLSLPTGRLRIDSANTMPLDPDDKTDRGQVVQVPPGDYLLTLYRVDWDELPRAGIKRYKGPQEFILLTPNKSARGKKPPASAKPAGPILPFQHRRPDSSWKRDQKVVTGQFKGRLIFNGFWEAFYVNLTRKQAAKLGLEPGMRVQLQCEKFTLDGLYLGEMLSIDFIRKYTKERLDRAVEPFNEFALSEWCRVDGREVLGFARYKSKRAVPERLQEVWKPATGVILPERWAMPE